MLSFRWRMFYLYCLISDTMKDLVASLESNLYLDTLVHLLWCSYSSWQKIPLACSLGCPQCRNPTVVYFTRILDMTRVFGRTRWRFHLTTKGGSKNVWMFLCIVVTKNDVVLWFVFPVTFFVISWYEFLTLIRYLRNITQHYTVLTLGLQFSTNYSF